MLLCTADALCCYCCKQYAVLLLDFSILHFMWTSVENAFRLQLYKVYNILQLVKLQS